MISKLPISDPALPLGPIEQGEARPKALTLTRPRVGNDQYREILKVTATVLIVAVLALAFVLSIEGIEPEDHSGPGPDRPPHVVLPAPAPAPG
jgi:hypothetical protein